MRHFVGVEIRGLQRYVFSTRRLLDAIGRSAIIADIADPTKDPLKSAIDAAAATVLFSGAGRVTVECDTPDSARVFAATYSRSLRDLDDDLQLVCAVVKGVDYQPSLIAWQLVLARAMAGVQHLPAPNPGFSVLCHVSGRPADMIVDDPHRGRQALQHTVVDARGAGQRWHDEQVAALDLPTPADLGPKQRAAWRWTLTRDLDELSADKGEFSQLAVIHLDVNRLGTALLAYAKQVDPTQMQAASGVIAAIISALSTHVMTVVAAAARGEGRPRIVGFPSRLDVGLTQRQGRRGAWILPVRPVVIAGDDLTLVCDARLAWSLALVAMEWISEPCSTLPATDPRRQLYEVSEARYEQGGFRADDRLGLTLGIGIAVIGSGLPLSRGYALAERLTETAKQQRSAGEHGLAWSTGERDHIDQAYEMLTRRNSNRTAQPISHGHLGQDDAARIFTELLGPHGLRRDKDGPPRGWLKSAITPLLDPTRTFRTKDLEAELARQTIAGRGAYTSDFPSVEDGQRDAKLALVSDALGLLDLHLDLRYPEREDGHDT